jgi:hypothetical protein
MVRLLWAPVTEPQWVIGEMATVVPPRLADIHSAQKSEAAVDHHELLMMRAAPGGMLGEAEAEVRARHPVKDHALEPLALTREDEVEVPREEIDAELGSSPAQAVEELQKAYVGARGHVGAAQEWHTAQQDPKEGTSRVPPIGEERSFT